MSETILSAHQPNFLPYLGFFDKMKKSDVFVIRDEVLFLKKEFHNRNRIRTNSNDLKKSQSKWISVPVEHKKDYIKHIQIKKDSYYKNKIIWNQRMLDEIKVSYQKAPYFEEFFPEFEKILSDSEDKLLSLNMKIIKFLAKSFNIKSRIIIASDLKLKKENYEESDASQDLADICKLLKANVYLSGSGGKDYLNPNPFKEQEIEIQFQEYNHPIYQQSLPGFLPYMSSIDALFCLGEFPESLEKSSTESKN